MKVTINKVILRKIPLKDLPVGGLFVLSEQSDAALLKMEFRSGLPTQPLKDIAPKDKCLAVSLSIGYVELIDENKEILPVDGEFTGDIQVI